MSIKVLKYRVKKISQQVEHKEKDMGSKVEKVKTIFYWSRFQGQEVGGGKQDKTKPENKGTNF